MCKDNISSYVSVNFLAGDLTIDAVEMLQWTKIEVVDLIVEDLVIVGTLIMTTIDETMEVVLRVETCVVDEITTMVSVK